MTICAHQLDLLFQIEVHAQRCIRAVLYSYAVSGTGVNMWAFTQNCFAESAILHWCKIFGSNNEPTHYTRFFNNESFELPDGTELSADVVKDRFCRSAGISVTEYRSIWENIKKGRDKFFVHNEFTTKDKLEFPDLLLLKKMALEIRDIVHEIISQEDLMDEEFHKNFKDLVQSNRNSRYLNKLQSDCDLLIKAISITNDAEQRH